VLADAYIYGPGENESAGKERAARPC